MRKTARYLIFLSLPIAFAALMAFQALLSAAKGPRTLVPFAFRGDTRESSLFVAAAQAGTQARLSKRPFGDAYADGFPGPGLVVWDEALVPLAPSLPPGGSPFSDLETLKDLTYAGSTALFGYRALTETAIESARHDLKATAGIEEIEWIGAYVVGLQDRGVIPDTFKAAWEASNGRPWDLRGSGLLLRDLKGGKALVLLRGKELGPASLRVRSVDSEGAPIPDGVDGSFTGWFCVLRPRTDAKIRATIDVDLTKPGRELFAANGLPSRFPALLERPYGRGRVATMAGDFAGLGASPEMIGILPSPRLERIRTLDVPENPIAQYQRLLVPLVSDLLSSLSPPVAEGGQTEWRLGELSIERRMPGGEWEPWSARGEDFATSSPGLPASEPSLDDEYYLDAFSSMADAGFGLVRVHSLHPPAFYRALARFNASGKRTLYLMQGIGLDADAPKGDLLDPAWSEAEMAESELCVDALHGRAKIGPRSLKSWGAYRIDVSPWLVAFLVGRDFLPGEIEATFNAHPDYRWEGKHFSVAPNHPLESFLAALAERVQSRELSLYGRSRPIGFVSSPTREALRYPAAPTSPSAFFPGVNFFR